MTDALAYFMMAAVLGGVLISKDRSIEEHVALGMMIGGLAIAGLDSMVVGFPQELTILAMVSALAIAIVSLAYDRS